jgi:hypothetical protein
MPLLVAQMKGFGAFADPAQSLLLTLYEFLITFCGKELTRG